LERQPRPFTWHKSTDEILDGLAGHYRSLNKAVDAGLVDALTLHLAPVLLGAGTRLFTGAAPRTLVQRSVPSTSTATT
jgi:dihydrofolate reductase